MASVATATASITSTVFSLGQALKQYADFLQGVEDEIRKLMNELEWMKAFLRDAEGKSDSSNLIRQWVSDVRNLAHDSEDLIDTFLLRIGDEPPEPASSKLGCFGCVSHCFLSTTKLPTTHKIGCKIKSLMNRAEEISKKKERYGLQPIAVASNTNTNVDVESFREFRRTTSFDDDEHFTGLTETVSQIKDELTRGESSRFVISIFGAGGLGKTTLARKLYNDLKLRTHFECQVWVYVSKEYNLLDVLSKLTESLRNQISVDTNLKYVSTIDSLETYIRSLLKNMRYLVVMDDVWQTDVWESLRRVFPDNNDGSRVIITTRNKRVATQPSRNVYVHNLRPLNEDESWDLFCKKASFCDGSASSPYLENLGRQMLSKCAGLPLAIVALGGLLSSKLLEGNEDNEWEMVRDNLWKELENGSVSISRVLALSFEDLSNELKNCFLYISMFPEDFEIEVSKLILLWVAEGLIGQEEAQCPEDVANSYFRELVGRSLIQSTGGDCFRATCRVHELVRDWALNKAKDVCFSRFCDKEENFSMELASSSHRRLAAYCSTHWSLPSNYTNHSLRTLVFELGVGQPLELEKFHKRFSLLRVLDLGHNRAVTLFKVPSEIGKLIHLKYLDLSQLFVVELPDTICELKALQTLITDKDQVISLPKAMEKLRNLRHLIGEYSNCSVLENSTSLQTLDCIRAEEGCKVYPQNLKNLRRLSVQRITKSQNLEFSRFYDSFNNMRSLQYFLLSMHNAIADIDLSEIAKRCPSILAVSLKGGGWGAENRQPDWAKDLFVSAVNLRKLYLDVHDPEYDTLQLFERLPSLQVLGITVRGIENQYQQMVCSDEGGFPQLKTLQIVLDDVVNMKLDVADGAMPLLKNLRLVCHDIQVPARLEHLVNRLLN